MKYTLGDMIREVKREIGLRERLYPRWVEQGKMSSFNADRQIEILKQVRSNLQAQEGKASGFDWTDEF